MSDSLTGVGLCGVQILGLDICADTIVGDQMQRGISGGQKKRVTTGKLASIPSAPCHAHGRLTSRGERWRADMILSASHGIV
jgi:hypothetical protein